MRKLQENPNGKLRSVQGMMAETNLSRYPAFKAEAKRKGKSLAVEIVDL